MDLMTMLAAIPGAGPLLPYVAAAIAVCAAVAVVMPHPAVGAKGLYPATYAAVNFIALNFGHATNARGPAASQTPPTA